MRGVRGGATFAHGSTVGGRTFAHDIGRAQGLSRDLRRRLVRRMDDSERVVGADGLAEPRQTLEADARIDGVLRAHAPAAEADHREADRARVAGQDRARRARRDGKDLGGGGQLALGRV